LEKCYFKDKCHNPGFSFLSEETDVSMKTINLAKGQGGYLNYRLKVQLILLAFVLIIWIVNLFIMKTPHDPYTFFGNS
jgi:hypothetical protein